MEGSSTKQQDTGKKPVENEPTESQNEGTILHTNYLLHLLVSLVIFVLIYKYYC